MAAARAPCAVVTRHSPLACALALGLACAPTGCGRSVRHEADAAAGASGNAVTAGGTSGFAGTAGAGGSAGAAVRLTPDEPVEARHVTVGAPVSTGCVSSVVPTVSGIRYAGHGNPASFSGTGEAAPGGGWTFTDATAPSDASGPALVFGDAAGQVVAWPRTTGISFSFFDADGNLTGESATDVQGVPLAAVGTPAEFSLAFSPANALSVMHFKDGKPVVVPIETEGCVEPRSVAVGSPDGDVVLGYFCNRFSATDAAQHLVVARVHRETNTVDRTVLPLVVGAATDSGIAESGIPAAFWDGDALLFAHLSFEGTLQIERVMVPGGIVETASPPSMPSINVNASEDNPVFSVVQVADEIVLTRGVCNRHEDARATGAFDVCRLSASSLRGECSKVEAPCEAGKLVVNGSDVLLLGCGSGSPTIVPLALDASPDAAPVTFPNGYSTFEPLALTCEGESCSALLDLDAARFVTGYDQRLAFADLEFAPGCTAATCRAKTPEPTAVFSATSDLGAYEPSVTLERQRAGLPLGVITLESDDGGLNYRPMLSVLERAGVRWAEPVKDGAAALFAQGGGYVGLWSDFFGRSLLQQYSVSEQGAVPSPAVSVRYAGSPLPGMTLCDGRVLIDAQTQESSISPVESAIVSYDPTTGSVATLFHPGYRALDSSAAPRSLGCAGNRLLVLDGLVVHQYTLSGEPGPDVALATPPAATIGDSVFTTLETLGDHVVVASSGSSKNVLDGLLFYADGTNRAFELPLPPKAAPLVALAFAPDRGDGWLRVLYQSGQETAYALREGFVYASAYKLFE